MTSPLLTAYGRTAELARGLKWVDEFESNETVLRNGGTITGAPVVNNGATFDGANDYITYAVSGDTFEDSDTISFVIEFTPDFPTDEDANRTLVEAPIGNYLIAKLNNASLNVLSIVLGGTNISDIPEATYSPAWVQNGRNVLVVSGTTGNTSAWLNGTLILDADATAWAATSQASFTVGATLVGADPFYGTITSVKVFNAQLTDQEALDYCDKTTWRYREHTKLYLPMRAEQHDPTGGLVLDDSGNGYNATLPAGEEPTKLTRRGYSYTPNDHLQTAFSISNDRGEGTLAALVRANATDDAVIMGTTEDDGDHLYLSMRNQLVSGGVGNDDWDVIQGGAADRLDVGVVHSVIMSWTWTEVYLYLDGELVYSAAQSGTPADSNIYVGALYDEASGDDITHWTGDIYEARVFDESLTPTQAWDLHLDMIGRLQHV